MLPGNAAPVLTLTGPSPDQRFAVGETTTLSATVRDAEDGVVPAAGVRWTVLLHHGEHTHPREAATQASLRVRFPAPESLAAAETSYLEVIAQVTDSGGVTTTVRRELRPHLVPLTFATDPAGQLVTVNGEQLTGPTTVTAWEGWLLNLAVPAQAGAPCTGWSDGGACSHQLVAPGTPTTYTARFG